MVGDVVGFRVGEIEGVIVGSYVGNGGLVGDVVGASEGTVSVCNTPKLNSVLATE